MTELDTSERRPFVAITLIVLATQAPYLFFTPGKHDPQALPVYGLLAGLLALVLDRPARLADVGITTRGLMRGVSWLVLALIAWALPLFVGWRLGWIEISDGVDRGAPDLMRAFVGRAVLLVAAVVLGDELAWRGVLLGDARARWGHARAIALVAVLSSLYRLPLLARVGMIDDAYAGGEIWLRELARALALGILFDRVRNLWLTGALALAFFASPVLVLGNAEDPFEPLYFYAGDGRRFVAVTWLADVLPLVALAAAALAIRERPRARAAPLTASDTATDP